MTRTLDFTAALEAARRARGGQRWRLAATGSRMDILLDPADESRQARVTAGAGVLNAQLVLAAAGFAATADFLPDKERPELLATLRVRARARPGTTDRALAQAIAGRRSRALLPPLAGAAAREGAELIPLDAASLPGEVVHSGQLVVLSSIADTPHAQLRAGCALQRVLLTSIARGAPVSVLPAPEKMSELQHALRERLGGWLNPQAVLDLGAAPAPPAQRRAVELPVPAR
ncbi:hypothetical protein FPZ12_022120 [Amycolatopsis acidicola]|uniref:Uncharacterized protein n=1 Tax=Amycolatopsis acidicola TaxID=2596893 RepID=A0A5N0V287_9PSEU|nr:hypothetical protein [Amycolatopsis acidicola]KAA9158756.1 hypothetical protein FPZ12_022120 [Amycolatopsis acidicola]